MMNSSSSGSITFGTVLLARESNESPSGKNNKLNLIQISNQFTLNSQHNDYPTIQYRTIEIEIKLQNRSQKLRIVNSLTGGADLLFPLSGGTTMAVRYYDIQRIRHLDSIPSTATYRNQYQQQQEGTAAEGAANLDLNFDQILTFRNAFMHTVIFFVLEQQVLAEQLENPNSILHLVQHACTTFQHHNAIPQSRTSNNANAQSANAQSTPNKAHGCARIFMVPEWISVLHSLASLQESLSPSKVKLKQEFFHKESTRFLHPLVDSTNTTGATGANTNDPKDEQEQPLDQKRVKQVVRSVFQEWAIQKGIDENDARVVLDALGSLEQIVKSGWSEDGLENVPVENSVKVLIRDFFGSVGGDVDVDLGANADLDLDGNGMEGRGSKGREFGEEWDWNDVNKNQNRNFGRHDRHWGATGMDHAAVNGRPVDTIVTANQQQHYQQQKQQQQEDERFGGGQHEMNMGGDYCSTRLFGGGEQEVNHHVNRRVRHSQHRGSAAVVAAATPGSRPGSRPLALSQTKTTMGTNRWQQQQQMPQMQQQQQQMHYSQYEDYDMQMAAQHTHMSGEQQGQEYPQQRPLHSSSFRPQHAARATTPPPSFARAGIFPRRPANQSMTPRQQQMPMQMQMPISMQVPMQVQMQQSQSPMSQMWQRQNANNETRWMANRTPQQQNPIYMNNNTGTASVGYSQQSARSVRQRTMQGRYISRDGNGIGNGTGAGLGGTGGVGNVTGTYERNVNENVEPNPFQDFNYQNY